MNRAVRLCGVLILSMFVSATYAQQRQGGGQRQQPRTPEEMAKAETEWMMKELSLDKEMEKPLEELQLKHAKKQVEMRESLRAAGVQRGNFQEMRERMEKLNEEKNKELKKLIGEEKFKLYEKKLEERREAMRRRR